MLNSTYQQPEQMEQSWATANSQYNVTLSLVCAARQSCQPEPVIELNGRSRRQARDWLAVAAGDLICRSKKPDEQKR